MPTYYVYIMSNYAHTLYIGSTNDLARRVYQHKNTLIEGFTSKYTLTRLVYCEITDSSRAMVERERQLKGWTRARKIELIESLNPEWRDLSVEDAIDQSSSADEGQK